MQLNSTLEQHIAVFGESGSGKTVLLSSFYGSSQEPQYIQANPFRIFADDAGQGTRLHKNYLGMRNSATVPLPNRFVATSYSFRVSMKDAPPSKGNGTFDSLRLVWHDYPGEWFEQEVSGPEEAARKVETFRSLLGADVALLLVDGQRLLDNKGQEARYLRSLFTNFCNGLLTIKGDLLQNGEPLVEFPRIWILGLSKADLVPDMDVFAFRDLLVENAGDDIALLRDTLKELVAGGDALAVGEDFCLLSSAQFEPNKIEVGKRVGVELMLPIASMIPFERHLRWAQNKQLPAKVASDLLRGVGALGSVLSKSKLKIPQALGRFFNSPVVADIAALASAKLLEVNGEAMAKRDYLRATLSQFALDLDKGETDRVLLRSPR